MTKILNTIQELWEYLLYCPVCQAKTRQIDIDVAPEGTFKLINYSKGNQKLSLDTEASVQRKRYSIKYTINLLSNQFDLIIKDIGALTESVEKSSSPYFYFYLHSACSKCDLSNCSSNDLELDLLRKKITNIGIEHENIYLLSKSSKYHITSMYDAGETLISKCHFDESGKIIESSKVFRIPITNFDYSKPYKVIQKIKTFLVFS